MKKGKYVKGEELTYKGQELLYKTEKLLYKGEELRQITVERTQ